MICTTEKRQRMLYFNKYNLLSESGFARFGVFSRIGCSDTASGVEASVGYRRCVSGQDAKVYAAFDIMVSKCLEEGMGQTDAKVKSYVYLLEHEYPRLEGKLYFVVGWKLPHEFEIYNEPDVIAAMQAHRDLQSLGRKGPTRMQINGHIQNWMQSMQ